MLPQTLLPQEGGKDRMMRKQIGRYHAERCVYLSGLVGIKPSEILAKDHKNRDEKIQRLFWSYCDAKTIQFFQITVWG
jgi:hypothetical protein